MYDEIDLFLGCRFHSLVINTGIFHKPSLLLTSIHDSKYIAYANDHSIDIVDLEADVDFLINELISKIKSFLLC